MKSFCGNCRNAEFERTPTGRIKKKLVGRCILQERIISFHTRKNVPPCIEVSAPTKRGIWADTEADSCAHWEPEL